MKTKISFILSNGLLFSAFISQLIFLALPNFYSVEEGLFGFDSVNCILWNAFSMFILIFVIGGISLMKIPLSIKKEHIRKNRLYVLFFLSMGILTGVSMLIHKEWSFFVAVTRGIGLVAAFAASILTMEFFLLDFENNLDKSISTNLITSRRHYLLGFIFVVFLLLLVLNSVVSKVSIDGKLHVLGTVISALIPLIIAWLAFYTSLFIKVYKINPNLGVFNLNREKKAFNYFGFISFAICLGVGVFNISYMLWWGLYAVSAIFFLELGRQSVKKFIVMRVS